MPGNNVHDFLQKFLVERLLFLHGSGFQHLLLPHPRQIMLMLDKQLYDPVIQIIETERFGNERIGILE